MGGLFTRKQDAPPPSPKMKAIDLAALQRKMRTPSKQPSTAPYRTLESLKKAASGERKEPPPVLSALQQSLNKKADLDRLRKIREDRERREAEQRAWREAEERKRQAHREELMRMANERLAAAKAAAARYASSFVAAANEGKEQGHAATIHSTPTKVDDLEWDERIRRLKEKSAEQRKKEEDQYEWEMQQRENENKFKESEARRLDIRRQFEQRDQGIELLFQSNDKSVDSDDVSMLDGKSLDDALSQALVELDDVLDVHDTEEKKEDSKVTAKDYRAPSITIPQSKSAALLFDNEIHESEYTTPITENGKKGFFQSMKKIISPRLANYSNPFAPKPAASNPIVETVSSVDSATMDVDIAKKRALDEAKKTDGAMFTTLERIKFSKPSLEEKKAEAEKRVKERLAEKKANQRNVPAKVAPNDGLTSLQRASATPVPDDTMDAATPDFVASNIHVRDVASDDVSRGSSRRKSTQSRSSVGSVGSRRSARVAAKAAVEAAAKVESPNKVSVRGKRKVANKVGSKAKTKVKKKTTTKMKAKAKPSRRSAQPVDAMVKDQLSMGLEEEAVAVSVETEKNAKPSHSSARSTRSKGSAAKSVAEVSMEKKKTDAATNNSNLPFGILMEQQPEVWTEDPRLSFCDASFISNLTDDRTS